MVLIPSPRHSPEDIEQWSRDLRVDEINMIRWSRKLAKTSAEATAEMRRFISEGGYAGCSWGKDSVTVAHLIAASGIVCPVVWVRVDGVENPDCPIVRDAFLARFDIDYHEIRAPAGKRRTSEDGFRIAAERFGDRHISGVRGDEATYRAIRMARWGLSTSRTCAPIGRWSTAQVFAYAKLHDLPLHPAYAQTGGGMWPRDRIRVGALGGERGTGHGRREWEELYYREDLARLRRGA